METPKLGRFLKRIKQKYELPILENGSWVRTHLNLTGSQRGTMAGLSPWARAVLVERVPRKSKKPDKTAVAGSKTEVHCQLQSQGNPGSASPHHPFNMEQPDSRLSLWCQNVKWFSFRLWNMTNTALLQERCLSWAQPLDCP